MYLFIWVISLCVLCPFILQAKGKQTGGTIHLSKIPFEQIAALHKNNWLYWQEYDGSPYNPSGGSMGLYQGISHIYGDGFLFGTMENEQIEMSGSLYKSVLNPLYDRIFRVRRNWRELSKTEIEQELRARGYARVSEADIQQFLDYLAYNWEHWPWQDGAPWVDKNQNGVYDPDVDVAGYPFSSEMLFCKLDDRDEEKVRDYFCTFPIGLEISVLVWAADAPFGRLGATLFKTLRVKNIRGSDIDSVYFSVWVDPDVGNYYDDLVGCDSALGLAFGYNSTNIDAEFQQYGLAPGAVGYDVVLGPAVPSAGDTAWVNGKRMPGYKNLSMTSFYRRAPISFEYIDPPTPCYIYPEQMFNVLRGYKATDDPFNPQHQVHRNTGTPTFFPFNGDPVTGVGDLDGFDVPPGDRAFHLNVGPFSLSAGEEQEIHIAIMAGRPGETRTDAVADLKQTDTIIQKVADTYFQTIPSAPEIPQLMATPFTDKIILDWGENPTLTRTIETWNSPDANGTAFKFEGYVVYQFSSAGPDAKRIPIAVFDVKNGVKKVYAWRFIPEWGEWHRIPVIQGRDSGIQHTFVVEKDYLTDSPLVVGKEYYFGVSAYSYNPHPQLLDDQVLESSPARITVVPQAPPPGIHYASQIGESLPVEHTAGKSTGIVKVTVANPAMVRGSQYQIYFTIEDDSSSANWGEVVWNLRRMDDGAVLIEKHPVAMDAKAAIPALADGLSIRVVRPAKIFREFRVVANAGGPLPEPVGAAAGWYGFPGGRPTFGQQTNGSRWLIHQEMADVVRYEPFESYVTRYLPDGRWPGSYEIRFTGNGEAYFAWSTGGIHPIPFEVWNVGDMENPDDDYRLFVFVKDLESTKNLGEFNITHIDHAVSDESNDPMTDSYYCVAPWDTSPGEVGYQALRARVASQSDSEVVASGYWHQVQPGVSVPGLGGLVFVNWDGGYVPSGELPWGNYPYNGLIPEQGTVFQIVSNVPFTVADRYTITASPVEEGVELERTVVEGVTVYPNPYVAENPLASGGEEFVYFYHLPRRVTVRIFSLDGALVRKLEKDDASQFMRWDLRNASGRRVASGIYIAHLQMVLSDGSQVQKVLKIAILQGAERY